jgi:DNA gyrase subunit A
MDNGLKQASGSEYPYNVMSDDIEIPEGLKFLVAGYADYAKEVVTDRAISNIDGFKPSQRRILYTMKYMEKITDMSKSAGVVGAVLKLHPHGDASVYETLVRMTDSSEYMSIPYLHGKGTFGKVYSTEAAAAMRYTGVMLSENADLLFDGMDGIKMIPSEDSKYMEPELLPVSFPTILCNPTSGIAVGMASNIPSFNFHDVNKAVIELIETGDVTSLLAPDFTTKGSYVYDEAELRKIMEKGRGRLKLRGKWHMEGKTIIIDEIPYYTTSTAILKAIKDVQGISDASDLSDKHGFKLAIECSNKKNVDYVLTEVLKVSDLQMAMTTNLTVIVDNKPRVIGIKELLGEWVRFRSAVVEKNLKVDHDKVVNAIPRYELLVDLLSDEVKRTSFIKILAEQGSPKARGYLRSIYPTAAEDIFSWVLDMKLSALSGVASKANRLGQLREQKVQLETDLSNVTGVIVRQLKDLNAKYRFPRRTEITNEDYVFEKEENVVVKAEATPTVVVIDGKFVKKIRLTPASEKIEGIRCLSDDVISFVDTQGRLLRVNLENVDFVNERDRGVYLPVYLEVEDDFEVVCYELIQDKKVGYVFSDGFSSVVDYAEWVDSKRTTRITTNGVSPLSSLIIGEIDFTKSYLLLMTRTGKFGFAPTDFKFKHRTARTKLIPVKEGDEVTKIVSLTYTDIMRLVASPEKYMGKLSLLAHGDTFDSEYLQTIL